MLQVKTSRQIALEQAAFADAVENNLTRIVAAAATGDFSQRVDPDALPPALGKAGAAVNRLLDNLQSIHGDVERMRAEHDKGDIDVTIDAHKFGGEFRQMAQGINTLVGAHIATKKMAMDVVREFGRGNFDAPMEKLPGKKAFINDTIEQVRGNLKGLIAEMNKMSAQHEKGDIDVAIDAQKFDGDFRTMAQGINSMVAAHIAVKKMAMGVVKEFGRGNFDAPMERLPGKKAFINDTIEQVRGNLKGLIAEMNRMSSEHDKGDIDVVIDAQKFEGDFRTMAQGINNMVAGHIAVKKKAMACVKSFGEGDFSAPLETFPGKKVFINHTIEQVRANLMALIEDTGRLAKAAQAGQLDTRADGHARGRRPAYRRLPAHRGRRERRAGRHRHPAAGSAASVGGHGKWRFDQDHPWRLPGRLCRAEERRQQHGGQAGGSRQ
jgi:methyl-accepting chemotaxis protein